MSREAADGRAGTTAGPGPGTGTGQGTGTRGRTAVAPARARHLRTRLGLIVLGSLLVAVVGTVVLVDQLFGRAQRASLVDLLERDLQRVQALVAAGTLGADFVEQGAGGVRLQFVSNAGVVLLAPDATDPIPLAPTPVRSVTGERAELVGSAAWLLPSGLEIGTIRMALDVTEADADRATLRLSLLFAGGLLALVAGALAWVLVSGALRPLADLARQAVAVDPARPRLARYRGPEDEVAELARALNVALEAIAERQQAERDALAEVAHELAAPLTVVAGELRQLASAHPDDPRVRAAREAADELLHTSQDLLTLARGELDRAPDLSVVDLAAVARGVVDAYPGVTFATDGADGRVFAQPDRLRQVARNLVRNAVQAAGAERVRVAVEGGAEVRLRVEDDGPGMTPEALARVFDRYVSGRAGGVGVGLTVARRIVASFDGRIEARSEPGRGTVFEVTLPGWSSQVEGESAEA
ncbi:MAG: HAMP domain-containing sensor histidine kinase [Trueperaceae bacterium]